MLHLLNIPFNINTNCEGNKILYSENVLSSVISGLFHQVSEDTHWAPFLNISIHYIRETYPPPWGEVINFLLIAPTEGTEAHIFLERHAAHSVAHTYRMRLREKFSNEFDVP